MLSQLEVPEFNPNAKLYLVTYLSQGLKVKGYLAIPRGRGPFPLLIYCRGGIRNVGMTRLAWVERFVDAGYIVFAPLYRGNRGGEGREDFCGEDRHDVFEALSWLKLHPLVHEQHIHLFGFSRGSVMALYTAMKYKEVASVVVWGGVSDMTLTYEERIDLRKMLRRVIGGTPRRMPEAYRDRSPIYHLEELEAPVLLIHGAEDQQVAVGHATRLAIALDAANKTYTKRIYEEAGHFLQPHLFEQAINDMFTWIKDQS